MLISFFRVSQNGTHNFGNLPNRECPRNPDDHAAGRLGQAAPSNASEYQPGLGFRVQGLGFRI